MPWELVIKQPPMLEDLAISTLIKWYTSPVRKCFPMYGKDQQEITVENIVSSLTKTGSKYFNAIPKKFHDKLIAEAVRQISTVTRDIWKILSTPLKTPCGTFLEKLSQQEREQLRQRNISSKQNLALKMNLVGQIIETFFNEKVTELEFRDHHMISFVQSFSKFNLMPNLTRLTIMCHNCNRDRYERDLEMKTHILQILKEAQNLKYLKMGISVQIDDEILTSIVDNCKFIEELDFRLSKINNDSVHLFTQMAYLKTFHIDKVLTINCFKTVLLSCEHTENIRAAPCMNFNLIKIIQEIASQTDNSDKLIKVKSYSGVSNTSEQMLLLTNMCPLIERLILSDCRNQYIDFRSLAGFNYLSQLHLEDYSFYGNHVKEAFDEIGHNLRSVSFVRDYNTNLNALIHISQKCPNLESLIISNCIFTNYVPEYDENKIENPFSNLKTLYLFKGKFVQQDENLMNEVVNFLLSNCLNVEYVKIGYPDMISAFNAVNVGRLTCIKELEIKVHDSIPYQEMWNNSCIQ